MKNSSYFTTSDGTKIFFEIGGLNHCRYTIIFLHGLGGNSRVWNTQVVEFQKRGYRTITFDLRGHGLSDHPKNIKDYSLNKSVNDVLEFLKEHSIKDIVLIGHCLGGMIALKLASQMKTKPKALVIISTSTNPFRLNKFWRKYSNLFILLARLPLKSPITLGIIKQITFENFLNTSDYDLRRIFSDIIHTTFQSYIATTSHMTSLDDNRLLKDIACPTLIIHGAKDCIFPVATTKHLQHTIKDSKLVILPNANHIIPINNTGELTYHIDTYLNDVLLVN